MAQFEYGTILDSLMTPDVVSALGSVREHRGRQELYKTLQPATLERLCEVAKVQSTGASNRIENVSTSEVRLRKLMQHRVGPKTRDEREIAGYRYVLDMIHESHDSIPVTPGVILQLHRDLYRFCDVSFAGRWKDSDNIIAERSADGHVVTRFAPTSAAATPAAVERICEEYARWAKDGTYDPLLVSLVFAFDFVSIHPFNDGNGRMSRLLTLLLTYRSGYDVGKYVSIEAEVERTKGTYYEALAASSVGWAEERGDYAPFVTYMLGVMAACYADLDARVSLLSSGGKSEDILRAYFEGLVGTATKRRILDDNPTLSQRTVERVLQKLQAEGAIEKVGAARATAYRRVDR
ncbi:MAG: Fic family protein [Eggerthellaceae bacterium]|nr:Fic family protein [Eggerthellaceae bacterium]